MLINDLVELGALIRRRRTELNLSQNDLAEKVGTTRQWLSRLEKGKNDIGTARLLAVLGVLELNLEIRPPRLESAAMAIQEGVRAQSLISPEMERLLARMRGEGSAPLSDTYLPGTGLRVPDLTTSVEPNALEAGRRRIFEASLKLSQRAAETKTGKESDDAQS
ncbi:helix-turn-helix transcriptional regulator [Cryobacterium sp. CG_9.6]|uniref:helix-turn-helix domain-containing protein n=1 Tax=Cryobacterium sp. CG_9.6 TaxID=2760710 RepID=UPI00247382B2|nr:helix-turn-helix transcriptional regulator [Cryobacterium sp. CG_9.6]MDH6238219.1 transcriptional regulator with XRE-family HTH domain [Cryobacterium sp. CG_9.6]